MPSAGAFFGIAGFGIALAAVLLGAVFEAYRNRREENCYRYRPQEEPRYRPQEEPRYRPQEEPYRGPANCAICRNTLGTEELEHCRNTHCPAVFHVRCTAGRRSCSCGKRYPDKI